MLQEIINVANVGFVVIGPKLEIRLWNKWMVQATGIDSETACYQQADKLLPSIFNPFLIEKVRNAITMGIATNIPQADGDFTLSSQPVDITIQPLEARHYVHSLRPVREEVVDQLCLVQIRTNMAALKAGYAAHSEPGSEAEERGKKAEAERLNFLAMIGHQIRTPVNGVLGVAELLRDTELTPEQRKYISLLLRAGQSLQTFVNELTDLSYLEAGRVKLEEEVTNLPRLLEGVMGMFETLGSQKGLQAVLDVAANVPRHVIVDHQKLQQVLAVLLNNAFKFTHKGGVRLKVDFRQNGEQPELLLEVSDTGVGIPDHRIGTLFEPSKPSVDSGRFYNRTGLGLFLCRGLLDLLGGTVKVESALEKGTTFSLVVPVREAHDAVAANNGQGSRVGTGRRRTKWRVLLAEDNPVNQELFRALLEKEGHQVTIVSNGQEAVTAVQVQKPFDILLMDISMPVMDGLEATSLIRSLLGPAGKTPILALTAHALKGDREVFLNAGMDGYQSKPVEPEKLEEAMARAIASREANRSWADLRAPKQSAHPANGPMSWLRFPGSNRPRGTDRADQ